MAELLPNHLFLFSTSWGFSYDVTQIQTYKLKLFLVFTWRQKKKTKIKNFKFLPLSGKSYFQTYICWPVFILVDQTQTSARPVFAGTLNHEHCNVYSPKAFEALIQENVTYIVFFVVCKIYFLLVLSKCSIRSKTMCQNVQGLRHLYGNNHRTKIAVESVTLELCEWRDYFASSLLVKKTD